MTVEVTEWQPGGKSAVLWSLIALPIFVAGIFLFGLPVVLRAGSRGGQFAIGVFDLLLVLVLTGLLLVLHEAIHGLVMRAFGAQPRFGVTLIARVLPALFTTAPGHRFSREQYLSVAAAPTLILSTLGFLACFSPWGGYLVVPLACHLSGCIGDGVASWKVVQQPRGTLCEDLRDGVRFYRSAAQD